MTTGPTHNWPLGTPSHSWDGANFEGAVWGEGWVLTAAEQTKQSVDARLAGLLDGLTAIRLEMGEIREAEMGCTICADHFRWCMRRAANHADDMKSVLQSAQRNVSDATPDDAS